MPADDDGLAERLNHLFASTASLRGRCASNNEVAADIKAAHPEVRVSGAYLSALRSGKRSQPSVKLLRALADYFNVSMSYFTEPHHSDATAPTADRDTAELAAQLNELGVRRIALRAVGLNQDSLSTVTAVLDHVRKLQGLPAIEGDNDEGAGLGPSQ